MNKKDLSERDICSKLIGPAVKRSAVGPPRVLMLTPFNKTLRDGNGIELRLRYLRDPHLQRNVHRSLGEDFGLVSRRKVRA